MGFDMKRAELHERLPLDMPFSVHIFPSFYCNFRCGYCLHSLDADRLAAKGFQRQHMEFGVYRKALADMSAKGWRLKALIFAGHGEPLLHPEIAKMVALAKEKGIADRVEIVTNGSLLTQDLSDALIAAGLDRLRISLQGVTTEQYREVSGVRIDFERFMEQLRYFYRQKRETEVYIKIIDLALKEPGDRERFEALCVGAADVHAVEYAIPFVPEIDLGTVSGNCKQGNRRRSAICSMPFYMMVLYPNGDVLPCCATDQPAVFGNVLEEDITEIWRSGRRNRFLLRQLEGARTIPVCGACAVPAFGLQEGDYLDGYAEELKAAYRREPVPEREEERGHV